MRLLFFLTQKALVVSFVDDRRSISARDPVMGLAGRGRSRRGVPREPVGSPRLQYYAKRTEPQIFITSRRARIKD